MKVAIAGARGKMGTLAYEAIQRESDLEYAGGFARVGDQSMGVYDNVEQLFAERNPDVVVDFTPRPVTQNVAHAAVERGISPVIGSSEWNEAERADLRKLCAQRSVGALIVPNFSIGAILMMNFAQQAAPFFESCEIIEMHRAEKRDKPSGTAAATAETIRASADGKGARGNDVPIHSVRMKGLLAHQEVLFSNAGELLTIRHDSFSRDSFAAGIIAAIRYVRSIHALEMGLKHAVLR